MKIYLFVASDNLLKSINIYSEIILKSIQELGSFTIINFNNILKKKQNLTDDQNNIFILKNKFGDKINYISPSKKSEFLEYIGNDKIFAIDSLGKTFFFFSIRRLIKKTNINKGDKIISIFSVLTLSLFLKGCSIKKKLVNEKVIRKKIKLK